MPIYLPELKGEKRAGLYIISATKNAKHFKVGKSVDIQKRLDQYHLCFPTGFYIHGILLMKKNSNFGQLFTRNVQKPKNLISYTAGIWEKMLVSNLIDKGAREVVVEDEVKTRTRSEWLEIKDKTIITKALDDLYKTEYEHFVKPYYNFKPVKFHLAYKN